MARSSKLTLPANWTREPRYFMRVVLGVLVLANLIAAWTAMSPVGGSAEQLEAQIGSLRSQVQQRRSALGRLHSITSRVDTARTATDQFLGTYFMSRRTASSTIVAELSRLAREAGMKPLEHSFAFDPIEGSDELSMMTVTGSYEGTYGDLLQLVNRLDKSARFLIVDSMNATPLQGGGGLRVTIKMNTFVREGQPLPGAGQTVAAMMPATAPAAEGTR